MIKSQAKAKWIKKLGLNPNDFEKAWTAYSSSTCCDWCKNDYKSSRDKNMDHCHQDDDYHTKGDFRNILCQNCNLWRNNATNICKYWCKRIKKYYYKIQVTRNGKKILHKSRTTLEEVEELLLEFKRNNGFYFPFWYE